MIIECPACGARAKLPDSKEGAKVRCAECERVYHARPSGARAAARSSSSALPVGIGAGVVALVIVVFAMTGRGPATTAAPPVPEPEEVQIAVVDYGFTSPLCKFARGLHDAAAVGD
ncbi:MAG: zinc-ribbon domain-containing protein, partial [Planctomycetota bacterium]|nr:zinc-ribbon domain-containing protein [Planctomycetota bacterium]